jgi:hypothetical protein
MLPAPLNIDTPKPTPNTPPSQPSKQARTLSSSSTQKPITTYFSHQPSHQPSSSTPPQQPRKDAPSRPSSPERPPISPIDAEKVAAQLAALPPYRRPKAPSPTFIPRPPPVPISESENSDAIALRSAIALLQLQKEKSRRDILTLQEVKQKALRDPGGFLDTLQTRKRDESVRGDVLAPTLHGRMDSVANFAADREGRRKASPSPRPDARRQPSSTVIKTEIPDTQDTSMLDVDDEKPSSADSKSSSEAGDAEPGAFPPLPKPQNVFRMPPINWAKYHVVGEPLDGLHEQQRRRPNLGQPGMPDAGGGSVASPYMMAAPYSPFTDQLPPAEHPMQTRRGAKKTT